MPDYLKNQLISWIDLIEKEDENYLILIDQLEKEGFYNNIVLRTAVNGFLGEELTKKIII